MSSSVAVADPPTKSSDPISISPSDVDEDEEYEEIEVEEYEEIEVEEEDKDEVEAEEEAATAMEAVEEAATAAVEEEREEKDGTQVLELVDVEEHLRSGLTTPKQPIANPDTPMIGEGHGSCRISSSDEIRETNDSSLNGKRTLVHSDFQAFGCANGETNTHKIQPLGQNVSAEILNSDVSGKEVISDQFTAEGSNQEALVDLKQKSSRLDVRKTRGRSLSGAADYSGGNKRLANRCEFFAQGWCIKGNSCRFLHIREHVTIHDKDEILDAAKIKSQVEKGEGLENTTERPALDGFSDSAPSAVQCEENLRSNSDKELHMHKDEPWSSTSFRDTGREALGRKSYLASNSSSSPLLKDGSRYNNSFVGGMLPSSSVLSSENYRYAGVSSHASGLDDLSYKSTQRLLDNHSFPVLNHFVDRWPYYRSSSSHNLDPIGYKKPLDRSQEYSSSRAISMLHKSSTFPGSDNERLSRTDLSGDTQLSSDYKTKVSFDDWEPSVPFRPSIFLSQITSRLGSQYDPIRDSIEQSSAGDGSAGVPVCTTHVQANADPVSTGILGSGQSSNKLSMSSHISHRGALPDTSITYQENMNTSSNDEKYIESATLRGVTEADKLNVSTEAGKVSSRLRQKEESKLERLRHGYEIDIDCKTDTSANKESRVMKHFRDALVEFVKELLKPSWHEGLLTRDNYKMIVKKTVDKVVNSLPPNQIPDTPESIKQYLSASQPKLAKLIEGYVEKYGKS